MEFRYIYIIIHLIIRELKIHKTLIIFSLLTVFGILSACQFNRQYINREADRKEAETIIDNFYQFLSEKNYDAAFSFVNPFLWRTNDSIRMSQTIINLYAFSGGLKEKRLDHWETKRVVGYEQSAFYRMYYINKYDNLELKVSLVLQMDLMDGRIKIVRIQYSPDKFL